MIIQRAITSRAAVTFVSVGDKYVQLPGQNLFTQCCFVCVFLSFMESKISFRPNAQKSNYILHMQHVIEHTRMYIYYYYNS